VVYHTDIYVTLPYINEHQAATLTTTDTLRIIHVLCIVSHYNTQQQSSLN